MPTANKDCMRLIASVRYCTMCHGACRYIESFFNFEKHMPPSGAASLCAFDKSKGNLRQEGSCDTPTSPLLIP